MLIWDLVYNKIISLNEIETTYNYDDLMRLCAIANYNNAIEKRLEKYYKEQSKRSR